MNKIGFQNFRRFIDFKPLEYKGITFLVGRNNSGKSTLVKALLLINDFLKSKQVSSFSFGNNVLEDANIVTYERAKNSFAKENFISFFYQIDNFDIEIKISGEAGKTSADVHLFSIKDSIDQIEFLIQPQISTVTINRHNIQAELNTETSTVEILGKEIESLKLSIEKSELKKSSKEYIELIDKLNSLIKKRNSLAHIFNSEDDEDYNQLKEPEIEYPYISKYSVSTYFSADQKLIEIIDFIISESIFIHDQGFRKIQAGEEEPENFIHYRSFYQDRSKIESTFKKFLELIDQSSIIYLGANPAKQSALFAIRDTNNALAQSIHEFKQLGIDKDTGSIAFLFTKKWMNETMFEIGDDLKIDMHAGEAYEVRVQSNKIYIPLADKGMGSIQAMLLILRLACIIHKNPKSDRKTTVIIEEPELNLHPALQSKLASLFHEVYIKYGIQLIIETHSEYLIRNTQLIVKENEYEIKPNLNPFSVFYFDKDMKQWKMNYRQDGKFIEEFGKGFYDESAILTLKLL